MAHPTGERFEKPLRVNFDHRPKLMCYFRADAGFAMPEVHEFLEAEGFAYAIRLPANKVLQDSVAHLLKRPVGRSPNEVRRYHVSFGYQAATWSKPRRVVAKVEWRPGELFPRVGLDPLRGSSVTNLSRPAGRVVAFDNRRGTADQHIKGEARRAMNQERDQPDPGSTHLRPSSGRTVTSHPATACATTRCVFSCARSPTTWATSCARWPCPRRWKTGP